MNDNTKQTFINYEIWILTFGGAFQRAGVYLPTVDEKVRSDFRKHLKIEVETLLSQYLASVSDEQHIKNIKLLSNKTATSKYTSYLTNGTLNFGVSQKLLNLYLKYQWCLGNIVEPPHFPVDRIIQGTLGGKLVNWTSMIDEKDYLEIIKRARTIAEEQELSLAAWELKSFERR